MSKRTARKYLDGLDPMLELGVAPQFYRGEEFYDRAVIDRAVDASQGIAPPSGDDPDSALAAWQQSHGSA